MKLYTSNTLGVESNCIYPNEIDVIDVRSLERIASFDHVMAKYKNNYRSNDNFVESDCIAMDIDNDHTENSVAWISANDLKRIFDGVKFAIVYSRNHNKEKNGKAARPRMHIYFPIPKVTNLDEYVSIKEKLSETYTFFDGNALDGARFFYGVNNPVVEIVRGNKCITDNLKDDFEDFDNSGDLIQQGSRNSTMNHFAGRVLIRYGNSDEARRLFDKKASFCSPPLSDEELEKIWRSACKFYKKVAASDGYIPPEEYEFKEWEDPIPFEEYDLPKFPIDTLPDSIANYVNELSESTQTPPDMAATSALAVLSVCMQGRFKIRAKEDWEEPVNTFILNVMNPSERKSAVANSIIKPLNSFESKRNMENASIIEASRMQKRILEKRQKVIEENAAKAKAEKEDIEKIADEIASFKEVNPLKLYVDDITTEKLTSVIANNNGKAAILSTEAGIFDTLAGSYSRSVNIDVMLKGYSGDSIRVDRIGRNSESVMNPALTILLMAQPMVLSGLMQNPTFRGRGLTARFLYSIPKSFVGKRKYRSKSVSKKTYEEYERCIYNILEDETKTEVITLSKEADKLIEKFAEELEPHLKTVYKDISDWAGKLVGNILRIAALLTRANVRRSYDFLEDEPESLEVDKETMKKAIAIGNYFISHALVAFSLMGVSSNVSDAKLILKTVADKGLTEFSKRDIMRYCRKFKTANEVKEALQVLIDYGHVAVKEKEYRGIGRPPAEVYVMNPKSELCHISLN